MARTTIELIDVNGSFKRFVKQAPKVVRLELGEAVERTTFGIFGRMRATAPVGPDAPHMRDALDWEAKGLRGQAGILADDDQAHIALYNEYNPNSQPFMIPAAESEETAFKLRATKALQTVERILSSGV